MRIVRVGGETLKARQIVRDTPGERCGAAWITFQAVETSSMTRSSDIATIAVRFDKLGAMVSLLRAVALVATKAPTVMATSSD